MEEKRYLYGLDISMKQTGLAIYDLDKKEFVVIDSFNTEKIYATKKYKGLNLSAIKLKEAKEWFMKYVDEYPPNIASIERMFSRFNNETQTIAKMTGVIQECIWNIPHFLYPPKKVKSYIVHGSATKEDLFNSVLIKYPNIEVKNDDESDAIAVALTFLIDHEILKWKKPKFESIKTLRKNKK